MGQVGRRPPRLGVGLERADDQAAGLLLEVRPAVGVAHDRQVGVDAGHGLGDDVEVLGGVQRDGDPGEVSDRLGPLAGAVDDHLALEVSGVGADTGDPPPARAVLEVEAGHPHPFEDRGPALPGAAGERLGQVGGVDPPVAGQPDRAEQVVDRHRWPQLLGLGRRQHLAVEVVGDRVGRRTTELGEAVGGAGHDDAAHVAIAGGEPGLGLERVVELGGVLHEPGPGLRGPQRTHQPCRVPGGAARQRPLLEQHQVGETELGQVVGDRAADHSPTDDDDPRPLRKLNHRFGPPRRAVSAGAGSRRSRRPSRSAPSPSCGSRSRSGWPAPG